MAISPRIFGQSKPTDTVNPSLLYIVPIGLSAQVSIFAGNQTNGYDNFSIAIIPNGQTLSAARYLAFNTPLVANGVFALSNIGMSGGYSIVVKSSGANVAFTATGMEFS